MRKIKLDRSVNIPELRKRLGEGYVLTPTTTTSHEFILTRLPISDDRCTQCGENIPINGLAVCTVCNTKLERELA